MRVYVCGVDVGLYVESVRVYVWVHLCARGSLRESVQESMHLKVSLALSGLVIARS